MEESDQFCHGISVIVVPARNLPFMQHRSRNLESACSIHKTQQQQMCKVLLVRYKGTQDKLLRQEHFTSSNRAAREH